MDACLRGLNENIHSVLRGSAEIVAASLGAEGGIMGAADLAWGVSDD
jgi:hypothetical protein